jgi:hypothetical protein
MDNIKVGLATEKDKKQLIEHFRYYKKLAEKRADCYIKHNFTIVAKDKEKIIGVLQWYIKEAPKAGGC